jgi:hypothetical protein
MNSIIDYKKSGYDIQFNDKQKEIEKISEEIQQTKDLCKKLLLKIKENEIKKELYLIEEKKAENNKEIEVPKQTLGFFGRLMAPIFLTENEIKNIQNSNH